METNRFPRAPLASANPSEAFINKHFPGALEALQALKESNTDCEYGPLTVTHEGYLVEENGPLYWDGVSWDDLGPTE